MLNGSIVALAALLTSILSVNSVKAQVATPLSAYVDPNGLLDVQALTCAQLAGTYQQDADMLMAWYSGWYNGLAKGRHIDIARGKELEHQVIVYCKENREKRVIQAIDVVFKSYRDARGIKLKQ